MIAIVDYGVGNLFSLVSSLKALGLAAEITGDAARLRAADGCGLSARRMDIPLPAIISVR